MDNGNENEHNDNDNGKWQWTTETGQEATTRPPIETVEGATPESPTETVKGTRTGPPTILSLTFLSPLRLSNLQPIVISASHSMNQVSSI